MNQPPIERLSAQEVMQVTAFIKGLSEGIGMDAFTAYLTGQRIGDNGEEVSRMEEAEALRNNPDAALIGEVLQEYVANMRAALDIIDRVALDVGLYGPSLPDPDTIVIPDTIEALGFE
jgi:hypothetical protein